MKIYVIGKPIKHSLSNNTELLAKKVLKPFVYKKRSGENNLSKL